MNTSYCAKNWDSKYTTADMEEVIVYKNRFAALFRVSNIKTTLVRDYALLSLKYHTNSRGSDNQRQKVKAKS